MNAKLFEYTKLASYFLWEYTHYDNALKLWYCAQDMAACMKRAGIASHADIDAIKNKGMRDAAYVSFVRHIAYRIYIYSKNDDAVANWYNAEKLLTNYEWCAAMAGITAVSGRDGQADTEE
jgi:hypothetical protein